MMNQDQRVSIPSFLLESSVSVARNRANVYELLASCFLLEPTHERLDDYINILKQLEIDSNPFWGQRFELPQEITELYYERFFVPFSQKYVPPIESAIRGNDPLNPKKPFGSLSMADSHSIDSCYKAAGFSPFELEMFEPLQGIQFMDHMGFELAFMSYLCYAEDQSIQDENGENAANWRKLQQQFLNRHLAQWSGRYADLMEERSHDFYSEVARYVAVWTEIDTEMLVRENCQ